MVDRYYVIPEGCHRAVADKRVYSCDGGEGSIGITCMDARPKEGDRCIQRGGLCNRVEDQD